MKNKLKVLIACEESQALCKEFRKLGHEAYSSDIKPCSGGHPEWHIQGDCRKIFKDGWDLMIAHPPCTYLTAAGNRWFNHERYGMNAIEREKLRAEAFDFFMQCVDAPIPHIAVENPIGYPNTHFRKPDQIVQPYQFGDKSRKSTCLWLFNLPKLTPTKTVEPDIVRFSSGKTMSRDYAEASSLPKNLRSEKRSKTYLGIAAAMADQWSRYILTEK